MAFPQIAAVNGGNNAINSVSHIVNLPTDIVSGNLLLVLFVSDGIPTITFPAGWMPLFDKEKTSVKFGCWYRIADGTEDATITVTTSTSEKTAHTSYRITDYSGLPEAAIATSSGTSVPNPPSLTPSWGEQDTLWIASEGNDASASVNSYPTNYTDGRNDYVDSTEACGVGSARRELNAISEDPGAFTISSAQPCVAATIAIAPIGPPTVYHFNSRSTANWANPANMVDGALDTYSTTSSDGDTELLNGNTCPGTNLGTITKVEIRVYGYGDADDLLQLTPVFSGGDGGLHSAAPGINPVWSSHYDITSDTNHPDWSSWSHVQDLDVKVIFTKSGKANTMHCAKVEIRVTYTPSGPPAKPTQYLAGKDYPEFPHEKDLMSDKLPCPPPYD